jgi:hypothetical protein
MNRKKIFALLCGAAFIVCGFTACEQGATPKPRPEDGFTSIQQLADYLATAASNGVDDSYKLKLSGVNLEGGLNDIFAALNGRYVHLDLSGCKGIEIKALTQAELASRQNRDRLTGLVLPPSIAIIGDYAFYGTTALAALTLPPGLVSIGNYAFTGCSALKELELPARTKSVGSQAFASCTALTKVKIPEAFQTFGDMAFSLCTALVECYLPEAPPYGNNVFGGCHENLIFIVPSSRGWANYEASAQWDLYRLQFVLLNPQDEASRHQLYFDYGRRRTPQDGAETGSYTTPAGRLLVLAPVRWGFSEEVVYEWKVDGQTQHGVTGEYLRFTPQAQGRYTVTCTAREGSPVIERTATTYVDAVEPNAETLRKRPRTEGSKQRVADCFDFTPAPGVFVGEYPTIDFSPSSTEESVRQKCQNKLDGIEALWGPYYVGWSLANCGGYLVTGFDHSVEKRPQGMELEIKGNAVLSIPEPGVIWVMQDSNGNGQPDDVWYELKGGMYGNYYSPRRYAITYFNPYAKAGNAIVTWIDNQGNSGVFRNTKYPHSVKGDSITFVLSKLEVMTNVTGYVDSSPEWFNIADAVQADGTPVDLAYIDFVKVQSAFNMTNEGGGGISTEMTEPADLSMPPDTKIYGLSLGAGMYRFTFINASSYMLTITFEAHADFRLAPGAQRTFETPLQVCYYAVEPRITRERLTDYGTLTFSDYEEAP